jgi:hypothetical protein
VARPFDIKAEWDSRDLRQWRGAAKQVPFALSLFANRLAEKVHSNERKVMQQRFDRPTPYTMNSLRILYGNKRKPEARVWFKDKAAKGTAAEKYLFPEVYGGPRPHKRMEQLLQSSGWLKKGQYLVPTNHAPKDIYGNVSRGLVAKILSGLRAHSGVGFDANATSSRRSKKKGNADRFFFQEIDGQWAICERVASAFGAGIRPLFLVEDTAPMYRVRFPFFQVGESTVRAHGERIYKTAFAEALATAK